MFRDGRCDLCTRPGIIVPVALSSEGMLTEHEHRDLLRQLSRNGQAKVRCIGRSMEPTIRLGQEVSVSACDSVRVGDVVLFETQSGGHVLHRIILSVPGVPWLVHKGDAIEGHMGLIHRSQIVGRVSTPNRQPTCAEVWLAAKRMGRAAWNVTRRFVVHSWE